MKSLYIKLLILSTIKSFAAPGCIDNSYHLTQLFDYKNYHYVACNCPCQKQYKIISKRAQCQKCHHYRDPYYTNPLVHVKQPTICLAQKKDKVVTDYPVGYTKKIMKKS
jgi:hypothetical protein